MCSYGLSLKSFKLLRKWTLRFELLLKKMICFETGSLIEIMSLGNQSHQLLNHLREHPLILGHDLVSPGSLHLPKWKNPILISDSIECIAESTCFCPHRLRYLNFGFAYFINLLIACNDKNNYMSTIDKCSRRD